LLGGCDFFASSVKLFGFKSHLYFTIEASRKSTETQELGFFPALFVFVVWKI
jgi:hypothetical protein